MKYFVVSDVHGFYNEMIAALNKAGFDKTNENHTLISLGDAMDRGPQPLEVIKYFNSLPRKILIKGNHEDLLEELCKKDEPEDYDKSNGTVKTMEILARARCNEMGIQGFPYLSHKYFKSAGVFAAHNSDWIKYKAQLIDYFETEHCIFVHGWFPLKQVKVRCKTDKWKTEIEYHYIPNWRELPASDWYQARWINGFHATLAEMYEPNKMLYCGHIHTRDWNVFYDNNLSYDAYIGDNVTAIDGCTALTGQVNVVVVED